MSGTVFSAYARYYDLLYRDKDYARESDYVAALFQRFHPHVVSVLELGSGTGRHAALLAGKGYRVLGVERSAGMLERARALVQTPATGEAAGAHPPPEFVEGDIRAVRVDRQFDAAISLFHVISYQTTNTDLLQAFETACLHVKKGGVFVFDVWYGPAVLTTPPAVRVKRMADDSIEVTRLAEPLLLPNSNLVEVNYHVFIRTKVTGAVSETREKHEMRYLFAPEIDLLLGQSGFERLHAEEWLSGRTPGCGTWGVCFVARRL